MEWRGEVLQRSTKCRNRNDALDVEAAWRIGLAKGEVGLLDHRNCPTVEDFGPRFFKYLPGRVSKQTEQFYKTAWAHLTAFPPMAKAKLYAVDEALIARCVTALQEKKWMPATINHALRTLKRALRLAHEWRLINRVPKIAMLPGERQRQFIISEALLAKMLQHEKCTPLLRVALPFLLDTGLRVSEAIALTWTRVNLEPQPGAARGWIFIPRGKSKYAVRHIPLTARAAECLRQLEKINGSKSEVFGASRRRISRDFAALRDALGLPWDCVIHSCRHTFCTRLAQSGADSFSLQKLAGHSSVVTSQRYVHAQPPRLEQAIAGLEALQKPIQNESNPTGKT